MLEMPGMLEMPRDAKVSGTLVMVGTRWHGRRPRQE
jgi:hypothetical protein